MSLSQLARARRGAEAWALLRKLRLQRKVTPEEYTQCADALHTDWATSLRLLAFVRADDATTTFRGYPSILQALASARQWRIAIGVLAGMPPTLRTAQLYKTAFAACDSDDSIWGALEELKKACDEGETWIDYTVAGDAALAGLRSWQSAIQLLTQGSMWAPTTIGAVNHVIRHCAEEGAWEQCVAMTGMLERRDGFCSGKCGLQPDRGTYQATIDALTRAKKWQQCIALLARLNANKDTRVRDIYVVNNCLSACNEAEQWPSVDSIMANCLLDPVVRPSVVTFNTYLHSLTKKRSEWARALDIFHYAMPHHNRKPSVITYSIVMSALEKRGDPEGALRLFARIDVPNTICTNIALNALEQLQRVDDATRLFERALRLDIYDPMHKNEPGVFDFHDFSPAAARACLRVYLRSLVSADDPSCIAEDLVIVTGKGLRSSQGAVLRYEVYDYLVDGLNLPGEIAAKNLGRLKVTAASLRAWVRAQKESPRI
eukprot:GEMP01028512.1.p1 GENE.GEMP01028512.1~~GEMP01028512.1.p1  ORF type:complete len:488 (+),score=126.71 GEMP01028512.1:246-1709(+)